MQDQASHLRLLMENSVKEVKDALPTKKDKSPIINARVIAVTSGKGGVGKTNFTVNLALAMQQEGNKVLIIDADIGMANVDVILGTFSKYNLLDLLKEDITLEDVLMTTASGLSYISGGSGIKEAQELSLTERVILQNKLLLCEQFADIILIDTGAGIGKYVLDFLLASDEIILLTTPEPPALADAYALIKVYSFYAKEKNLKLVVNRVYNEMESRDVFKKLQSTSEKFLDMQVESIGYIYEDNFVTKAVRNQLPLILLQQDSPAAKCIFNIAKKLLYGHKQEVKLGWRNFLRRLFGSY